MEVSPELYELRLAGDAGGLSLLRGLQFSGNVIPPPSSADTRGSESAEAGTLSSLPPALVIDDSRAVAQARAIAARLALRRVRPNRARAQLGVGKARSVPYRGNGDEIDLDRTLDSLAQKRELAAEDIHVVERRLHRRSVVLLVDASGSTHGERLLTAAATVGALSRELARDHFGVIAFWSDAAVLAHLDRPAPLDTVVSALASLRGRGLTNIAFPLEVAQSLLARQGAVPGLARVILYSDCIHNAGPNPTVLARNLPRLDVLLDVAGDHDEAAARRLARAGRGRLRTVGQYRDVAGALNEIFSAD